MEEFNLVIKEIKKIYKILYPNKDSDIICCFKGNEYGLTKSWTVKIDNRETKAETLDYAARELLTLLKEEAATKVRMLENEAKILQFILYTS